MSTQSSPASRVRSYYYFRIFIGWIGIAFPFVLLVGHVLLERREILGAISDYNYSAVMRNTFVGGLVALGMLLISYQYSRVDNVVSTIAGLCAMGVAFFPEAPPVPPPTGFTKLEIIVGDLHYFFAAAFFLILAYMAFFLFTRPADPWSQARACLTRLVRGKPPVGWTPPDLTPRKRKRNQVYLACGSIIVLCIALLVLLLLPLQVFSIPALVWAHHPVYWLETVAILAFGAAWIVKGEVILKDKVAVTKPTTKP